MQPNADLARTLCATTGDSASRGSRKRLVSRSAAKPGNRCRNGTKWMSEIGPLPLPPGYATRDNYFFILF